MPIFRSSPASTAATARATAASPPTLAHWLVLVRPRIGVFVVLAAATGAILAGDAGFARVLEASLYVGLVASASSVFNQILERDLDRRMTRTAERPLATGLISVKGAVAFAAGLAGVGVTGLALSFNPLAALLSLSTLVVYVLCYTPLKRHSSLNTVVGALPGAMPPLLGAVAVAGAPGTWGWMLFALVFAWQFPHFLAIAWLFREDYRRVGMKMLPVLPGCEGLAGRQAFLYAMLVLSVSLLPGMRGDAGPLYTFVALGAGVAYVATSAAFARRETRRTARAVLLTSLFHLPLVLAAALADPYLVPVLP